MVEVLLGIVWITVRHIIGNIKSIICMIIVGEIPIIVVVRRAETVGWLGIVMNIISVTIRMFGIWSCTILRNILPFAELSVRMVLLGLMAAWVGCELSWSGTGPWRGGMERFEFDSCKLRKALDDSSDEFECFSVIAGGRWPVEWGKFELVICNQYFNCLNDISERS
jgi:hypothetical protein